MKLGLVEIVFQAEQSIFSGPVRILGLELVILGQVLDTVIVVSFNLGIELLLKLVEVESTFEIVEDVDFDFGRIEVDKFRKELLEGDHATELHGSIERLNH